MGAVNTTYTFTPTDTITSTKMNNIIDETVMTADAVLDGSGGSGGLSISSGKLTISANAINSSRIANNAVTTSAIANDAVTPAKLSSGAPSWDSPGGTLTVNSRAIELGNGIASDGASFIDFHSSFPIIDNNARIIRNSGVNGTLQIDNNGTGAIVMSGSGGVTFGSANMPTPATAAKIYGIRAWARVSETGSVIENKGFSSISRGGEGVYNLVLSVTPSDNPCVVATCHPVANNYNWSAAVQINSFSSFVVKTGFRPENLLDDQAFSIMVIY